MEAPQRFQNCGERKDISDNGVALCVFKKIMSILLMLCDILDDGLTDTDLISASVDVIYALYEVAMAGLSEGTATRVMGGDTPNFEPSRILDYWDNASLPNSGLLDHEELSGNLGIIEGVDHCGGRQMHGQTLLRPKAVLPQLGFGGARVVEHARSKESSHSTFHCKQPEKSGKAWSKALKLSGSGARMQNNLNVANVQENISELFYSMERERNVKYDLLESLDWDNTFSGAGLPEPEELSRIIEELKAVYPLQGSNVKHVSGSLKPTTPMTPSKSSSASSTVTSEEDSGVLSSCGRASGRLEHVSSKESSLSTFHSKQPEKSGKACSKVLKAPTSQHKRISNGYAQVRKSNNPETYTVAERRVAHESTSKFAPVSSAVTAAASSAPCPGGISGSSSSKKCRFSPSKVNRTLKLPLASSNHNSGAKVGSKGKHYYLDNKSNMASDEENNSELSYSMELNRNDRYDLTEGLDWDNTLWSRSS